MASPASSKPAGSKPGEIPGWIYNVILPILNLLAALVVSGILILLIGENPINALWVLIQGAFGYADNIGYTLYYATSLIFVGLGFAVAAHGGKFNIGGEGQGYIGGLGIGLACLYLGSTPWPIVMLVAIVGGALFGGVWGLIPGYLAAKRGAHTVITTIMFNFIASALMTYLLVDVLIRPGQQNPESDTFAVTSQLPQVRDILLDFGINIPPNPLNVSFVIALLCCVIVYYYIWRTRWGYELRAVGQNEKAAVYAGISPTLITIISMTISGALCGLMGLNVLMGDQHRIVLNFTAGLGFVGIAVALMGRNHPFGILLASLLFGALYQGGSQLSFDIPVLNRDLVVVIQGLVILFTGALENQFKPYLEWTYRRLTRQSVPQSTKEA